MLIHPCGKEISFRLDILTGLNDWPVINTVITVPYVCTQVTRSLFLTYHIHFSCTVFVSFTHLNVTPLCSLFKKNGFFATLKTEEFVIVSGSVSGYQSWYDFYYPMLQTHAVESLRKVMTFKCLLNYLFKNTKS